MYGNVPTGVAAGLSGSTTGGVVAASGGSDLSVMWMVLLAVTVVTVLATMARLLPRRSR